MFLKLIAMASIKLVGRKNEIIEQESPNRNGHKMETSKITDVKYRKTSLDGLYSNSMNCKNINIPYFYLKLHS